MSFSPATTSCCREVSTAGRSAIVGTTPCASKKLVSVIKGLLLFRNEAICPFKPFMVVFRPWQSLSTMANAFLVRAMDASHLRLTPAITWLSIACDCSNLTATCFNSSMTRPIVLFGAAEEKTASRLATATKNKTTRISTVLLHSRKYRTQYAQITTTNIA